MKYKKWTKEELDYVINNYSCSTINDMIKVLNRSAFSINIKASRLGIKKNKLGLDITIGEKFGLLTVIKRLDERDSNSNIMYLCKCNCGEERKYSATKLKQGRAKACGCQTGKNIKNRPRREPGEASLIGWYEQYIRGAQCRGWNFDLTIEQFKKLVEQDCHYCGAKPRLYNKYKGRDGKIIKTKNRNACSNEWFEKSWIKVNGLDRKDNNIGYSLENCIPCCSTCNKGKHTLSYKDFINYLNNLVIFRKNIINT